MICIDEYCRNRGKNSTCDTYSELSRLCASDGPGTYESWRGDSDVACGRFSILLWIPNQKVYIYHFKEELCFEAIFSDDC